MARNHLQEIADTLLRRAKDQGFIVPSDVREELVRAGQEETSWKDILGLAGTALSYRNGRYYYAPPGKSRMLVRARQETRNHRGVHRAVRWLIREQRAQLAVHVERRTHKRIEFVSPVEVETQDRRVHNLVTREISLSGIRLIGAAGFEGQKLRVWIPRPEGSNERCCFLAQVLWSAPVGDGLFENGGVFLELLEAQVPPLKLAP